ncbi:MAG: hypothetical protein AB7R69_00560 [Candidatus Babeliales bacterium]
MKRIRSCIAPAIIICSSLLLLRSGYQYIQAPGEVYISFDTVLSCKAAQEFSDYCTATFPTVDRATFCKVAQEHFPYIKDIEVHHRMLGKDRLKVAAYYPCYRINEQKILLESGSFIDQDYFNTECREDLFHLSCTQDIVFSSSARNWLQEYEDIIFDSFYVAFKNPTEIILTDKKDSSFKVVCSEKTRIEQKALDSYAQIKEMMKRSGRLKKGIYCKADFRFKNQIIVSCKKGES